MIHPFCLFSKRDNTMADQGFGRSWIFPPSALGMSIGQIHDHPLALELRASPSALGFRGGHGFDLCSSLGLRVEKYMTYQTPGRPFHMTQFQS